MDLDQVLCRADSLRAAATLRRLASHAVSGWALTGGIAIELHLALAGAETSLRPLHDLDFIAESFASIPNTLGEFLLRHVHPPPNDPPGKTMLQSVDPATAVRVDVFRAYGAELERLSAVEVAGTPWTMVSLEDLLARHARLCWDLVEGKPVAPKFARDLLRMAELPSLRISFKTIEAVWPDHRKPSMPESFAVTLARLRWEIPLRRQQLVAPVYSTDVAAVCPRCLGSDQLPLGDARQMLALLGYC